MSLLSIATPFTASLPIARVYAGSLVGALRSLLGLGLFVSLFLVFKPLVVGLFRAGIMFVNPRRSFADRAAHQHLRGVLMLNRMARDLDGTQPGLASELRSFAGRD